MTLQRFDNVCKRLLAKSIDFDELNELYVDYKETIKKYNQTPGAFIRGRFEDCEPYKHVNWLKSNQHKEHAKEILYNKVHCAMCDNGKEPCIGYCE